MKSENETNRMWRRLRLGAILTGLLLLTVLPSVSQSCALCYTQAASTGSKMIQALRDGILVLVIPPTLGSVGMILVLRRKRNQVRSSDSDAESGQDW
jgi:hypothetical protein